MAAVFPDLRQATRMIGLDLDGAPGPAAEVESLRRLLAAARARGLLIAHSYRGDGSSLEASVSPWRGLAPRPQEPVFMRSHADAFRSRQFCAWIGLHPLSLIVVGRPAGVASTTESAAALGHGALILVQAANSNHPDGTRLQPSPSHAAALTPAGAGAPGRIAHLFQGAANGPR